jgi:hypothetical protein
LERNSLGQRGEDIFKVLITEFVGTKPLFRPVHLGEKYPLLDFYVEVIGERRIRSYFFVQVKTTNTSINRRSKNLSVRLSKEHLNKLAKIPAPTFLVGIDNKKENGYLLSILQPSNNGISMLKLDYPINVRNLRLLKREIVDFWRHNNNKPITSNFL